VGQLGLGSIHAPGLDRRIEGYASRLAAAGLFNNRVAKRSAQRACSRCEVRGECSPCPLSIVHQPGNEDPNLIPQFACAFSRVAARYRKRFPPAADATRLVAGRARPPRLVRELVEHSRRKGGTT
jgi:hypothetical protein